MTLLFEPVLRPPPQTYPLIETEIKVTSVPDQRQRPSPQTYPLIETRSGGSRRAETKPSVDPFKLIHLLKQERHTQKRPAAFSSVDPFKLIHSLKHSLWP